MYLIVFFYDTPNEIIFPKHEQLEEFVRERHWECVHRETCIEAGWVVTTDSEEGILSYFRSRLDGGEFASIFRFAAKPDIVPKFSDVDELMVWADDCSDWRRDSSDLNEAE